MDIVVISSIVVSLQLMCQNIKLGFISIDDEYCARTLRVSKFKVFLKITFPLVINSIISSIVLSGTILKKVGNLINLYKYII